MIYVQPRESSRDPKFVTLINGPVNGQLIDRGHVKVDQSPRNATDCPHKHDDLEPYLTALHPSVHIGAIRFIRCRAHDHVSLCRVDLLHWARCDVDAIRR